jgi:hypothetical protein
MDGTEVRERREVLGDKSVNENRLDACRNRTVDSEVGDIRRRDLDRYERWTGLGGIGV